ncbi:DUF4214 domain-containing protein [Teichococcus wenyumeiae]|uniref:DUF4214 domain-containing protein n=1 Tax=Teichococcus wenyumeiae TaxID=2478470 RepID=UPI0013149081|nr:DUF4214 domain-containing protein [Pseudoroseomonas wenyumeiae]
MLSSRTISTSGDYNVTLGASSRIVVERNDATPANDPVVVSFSTASIGLLSSITVQHAALEISNLAGINVLTNFDIGDGGKLDLSNTINLNVASPINFTGVGGVLVVDHDLDIGLLSGIRGFDADDVISFRDIPVATSASYANGVLQVYNGTEQVARLAINGDFSGPLGVQLDGQGGINVGIGLGNGGGLPNDVNARGLHSEYILARTDLGQLYLQDQVSGRDGSTTITDGKYVLFSDGVGRFDASGVAQEVAHLYKAAFNRMADADGLEFWTNRVESGIQTERGVATGFTESDEFRNAYGSLDDLGFVQQLYRNVLGREGEQAGVENWLTLLQSGGGRDAALYGFSTSFENVVNNLSVMGDDEYGHAYRLYEAALNRAPETAGLNFWYNHLESGQSLTWVAQGFMNSDEYQQKYGGLDNGNFVEQLYQNVLGRGSDSAGFQNWMNALNSGASRADVLLGFSDSLENRIQTAEQTHDNWIFLS